MPAPKIPPSKQIDYTKVCFVIMPFGKKRVQKKMIDFDYIYDKVFAPAIAAVNLPEGGKLIPKRTDKDYFAANIDIEMFKYLEYSRIALVDITGLNANVFYELGVRHHANQSGTAIFRQEKLVPPFDISHIKALPYQYEPVKHIKASRAYIKKVLTDSLEYNRIDSPVQVALQAQHTGNPKIDPLLVGATNAFRKDDWDTAVDKYRQAIKVDDRNPLLHQELGLLLKSRGRWAEAVHHFEQATLLSPDYGEAWRELGIARNKLYMQAVKDATKGLETGEDDLLKAVTLKEDDFDAYASLGGIYKRQNLLEKSLKMYDLSVKVSNGHPYPLFNSILLQVRERGIRSITAKQKVYMKRAEASLRKQAENRPPYNIPWCFFDLSVLSMLMGKKKEALDMLKAGIKHSTESWQKNTHLETLMLVERQKDQLKGWKEAVELLEA